MSDIAEKPLTIATVSFSPQETPRANLEQICDIIRDVTQKGVGLIVFPECAMQGYPTELGLPNLDQHEHQLRYAESIPGPGTETIRSALANSDTVVVCGMTKAPDETRCGAGKIFQFSRGNHQLGSRGEI